MLKNIKAFVSSRGDTIRARIDVIEQLRSVATTDEERDRLAHQYEVLRAARAENYAIDQFLDEQ